MSETATALALESTNGNAEYTSEDVKVYRDAARIRRNGRVYMQEYERGKAIGDVQEIGASPAGQTGTRIAFRPDPEIFHGVTFDYDTLESRLRELAFLNKGLGITLADERSGKKETFR